MRGTFRDDKATPCNKRNRFEIIMPVRPRAPADLAMRSGSTTRFPCQRPLLDVRSSQGQSAPHNHDLRAYKEIAGWAGERTTRPLELGGNGGGGRDDEGGVEDDCI